MTSDRYRALVVDDEVPIQKLIAASLTRQAFECDVAADGRQAEEMASDTSYDVVVTDLKMPNMNGHAFALELLQRDNRPLIVVHTGVIEPRLAKDLLTRGVDDILFKPVDFGFLATKVRALVERRHVSPSVADVGDDKTRSAQRPSIQFPACDASANEPISLPKLNLKLAEVSRVVPISTAALDVYEMTRTCDWDLSQIAAAIQRDASLTTEVLRLANSALYNQCGRRIIQLDEAVLRIGQKRVGELALTANALSSLTPNILPWFDLGLTWKRSMAAGIALESLIELGGHEAIEEGLLLSAIMHPLGRVVLGMLFPKHYEVMLNRCSETGKTLQEQERHIFPTSHTQIMAHLLATWRIPPEVCVPLKFSLDDFSALARLSEPTRTKTELVTIAIAVGRFAVGQWNEWDLVQLPPINTLKRLGVQQAEALIHQSRSDVNKLAEFHPSRKSSRQPSQSAAPRREIAYCNLSDNGDPWLVELIGSAGFQVKECAPDDVRHLKEPSIINGIGTAPTRFAALRAGNGVLVVADQERRHVFSRFARCIALPDSYGRFREALVHHAGATAAPRETVPALASEQR